MNTYILAIETSCDETAAAVYSLEQGLKSHYLYSQIELQKEFGGVIPEIAARSHIEKIPTIIATALEKAAISLAAIDVFAVTSKPGLAGSLLVGLCFTKALAYALNKKLIGIDHLEGHIFSAFLEHKAIGFPHLCLTASGGHTALYKVDGYGDFTMLGQTLDDAAGEAFDKVAKLLGLSYPGGPLIEKYAELGGFEDFFSYPRSTTIAGFDFSFSGLKTAVLYDLIKRGAYDQATKKLLDTSDMLKQKVASSLLVCIADIFEQRITKALKTYPEISTFTLVGGVACNKYIQKRLQACAHKHNKHFYFPSAQFCTDNAAMIAFVAAYKVEKQQYADFSLDIFSK